MGLKSTLLLLLLLLANVRWKIKKIIDTLLFVENKCGMFVCGFVVGVGCFNCRDCNLDKQMITQFRMYNIFIGKNAVVYLEMWQKCIHISNY